MRAQLASRKKFQTHEHTLRAIYGLLNGTRTRPPPLPDARTTPTHTSVHVNRAMEQTPHSPDPHERDTGAHDKTTPDMRRHTPRAVPCTPLSARSATPHMLLRHGRHVLSLNDPRVNRCLTPSPHARGPAHGWLACRAHGPPSLHTAPAIGYTRRNHTRKSPEAILRPASRHLLACPTRLAISPAPRRLPCLRLRAWLGVQYSPHDDDQSSPETRSREAVSSSARRSP